MTLNAGHMYVLNPKADTRPTVASLRLKEVWAKKPIARFVRYAEQTRTLKTAER